MLHCITLGHIVIDEQNRVQVTRPIDKQAVLAVVQEMGRVDEEGSAWIGGYRLRFHNGRVDCPWLMPGRVPEAQEFARRVCERTGCTIWNIDKREQLTVEQVGLPFSRPPAAGDAG
ncbi:MAG: hypothetical protein AB7F89_21715 [Pirellulaceae bacterium]